ncbi:hypothetical protein PK28_04800 [Hymenobacter sp. DG25B]|jgi:hypothetical protein|nr:hypothetical protein PK28_04800 [Hymenobacter sp. DG25B]
MYTHHGMWLIRSRRPILLLVIAIAMPNVTVLLIQDKQVIAHSIYSYFYFLMPLLSVVSVTPGAGEMRAGWQFIKWIWQGPRLA